MQNYDTRTYLWPSKHTAGSFAGPSEWRFLCVCRCGLAFLCAAVILILHPDEGRRANGTLSSTFLCIHRLQMIKHRSLWLHNCIERCWNEQSGLHCQPSPPPPPPRHPPARPNPNTSTFLMCVYMNMYMCVCVYVFERAWTVLTALDTCKEQSDGGISRYHTGPTFYRYKTCMQTLDYFIPIPKPPPPINK